MMMICKTIKRDKQTECDLNWLAELSFTKSYNPSSYLLQNLLAPSPCTSISTSYKLLPLQSVLTESVQHTRSSNVHSRYTVLSQRSPINSRLHQPNKATAVEFCNHCIKPNAFSFPWYYLLCCFNRKLLTMLGLLIKLKHNQLAFHP